MELGLGPEHGAVQERREAFDQCGLGEDIDGAEAKQRQLQMVE
jgi:hypothetical protein